MTTFLQNPTLVIELAALACPAGGIGGHPPVDRRREKAQSERDERQDDEYQDKPADTAAPTVSMYCPAKAGGDQQDV
jgi:hypothetical protein